MSPRPRPGSDGRHRSLQEETYAVLALNDGQRDQRGDGHSSDRTRLDRTVVSSGTGTVSGLGNPCTTTHPYRGLAVFDGSSRDPVR
jgi:hypothetical protein